MTFTEALDVPLGPVQTRSKVVASVSPEDVSVPVGGRLPVQPFDAVQAVAFVLLQVSFAAAPYATVAESTLS